MNRRVEPRFAVRSPIRVIVPGRPARVLNCTLVDVSATGMSFIATEALTSDAMVAVEVDSRLVLAEIRYCQPRGDNFIVGVRRLHEVAKESELTDSAACATEMVSDLHRHISARGVRDSQAQAMKALERILEKGEVRNAPLSEESVPEALVTGETREAQATAISQVDNRVETQIEKVIERFPVEPIASEPIALKPIVSEPIEAEPIAPEPDALEPIGSGPSASESMGSGPNTLEPIGPGPMEVLDAEFTDVEIAHVPVAETPVEAASQMKISTVTELHIAKEHDVDARDTRAAAAGADPLQATRAELANASRERAGSKTPALVFRSWRAPVGIAAGLILASAIAVTLVQHYIQAAPPAASVAQPSKVAPAPVSASPAIPLDSDPSDSPSPVPVPETDKPPVDKAPVQKHHARIRLTGPSWISIAVDGAAPVQSVFHKGDVEEFDFVDAAVVWIGQSPNVEISIDNATASRLTGAVRRVRLTSSGMVDMQRASPSAPSPIK